MINLGVLKENIKEHNPIWSQIPNHLYRLNNWRLWIRKNKFILQFNNSATS